MDASQLNKILANNGGTDHLMAIIFDNSMKWFFNRREYKTKDDDGNLIPDGPDRYGDFIPVDDYFQIVSGDETVKMKRWFSVTTEEERQSGKSLRYYWEVRPIECIQLLIFCDDDNESMRGQMEVEVL